MGFRLNGCHVPVRSPYCANGFNESSFHMLLCFLSSPALWGRYIQSVWLCSIITGAAPTEKLPTPKSPSAANLKFRKQIIHAGVVDCDI